MATQLPGGVYWNSSPQLIQEAKTSSNTNISGDRNFAVANYEIQRAHRGKTGYVEGKVMYRVNETAEWFSGMSLDEKEERARLARLASKVIATEEKTDEEKHQDAIKAKLNQK